MATARRWLQFSLRGFIVVLTIGCLWLGWKVEGARRQREAVAEIEAVRAIVYYDTPDPGDGPRVLGSSSLPWWHHLLHKVDRVVLPKDIYPSGKSTPDFEQALMEVIPALRGLKGVDTVYVATPLVLSLKDVSIEDARIQDAERTLLGTLPDCKIVVGEPAY
jgi:hypothetical protein